MGNKLFLDKNCTESNLVCLTGSKVSLYESKKKDPNLYLDLDSKSSWSKKNKVHTEWFVLHFYCSVDKSILAIGLTFMMFEGVNGFKLLHVSDIKSFKNM